jgi:hypothetical protein
VLVKRGEERRREERKSRADIRANEVRGEKKAEAYEWKGKQKGKER